jgi:alpha-L-fucosidase
MKREVVMANKKDDAFRIDTMQREGAKADNRLAWWREAKFGLFIHWGLYAIPAGRWKGKFVEGIGEWIQHKARIPIKEYSELTKQFNPVKFNAREWVSMAKDSGQKYIAITAKHHDGFCIYKSDVGKFNINATPFDRDPLKELAEECARQGLKFGFYYSQTQDWNHPHGDGNDWDYDKPSMSWGDNEELTDRALIKRKRTDDEIKGFDSYIQNHVKPHVRELLTNYGPIGLIWFDTPKRITEKQSQELLDLCNELQPDCLVNGRLGNSLGDYCSAGDNAIPATLQGFDWETPATLNDTWAFKTDDHNWKSAEDLTKKLVDIVSKGGNYLLNVGPTAEGIIPEPSVERLLGVGDWLKKNGEGVYGTTAGPIQNVDWCRSTQKDGSVYIHVFDWPSDGKLKLSGLGRAINEATIIGDSKDSNLSIEVGDTFIVVNGPVKAPDPIISVIKLT